jgi:hypothetical protein
VFLKHAARVSCLDKRGPSSFIRKISHFVISPLYLENFTDPGKPRHIEKTAQFRENRVDPRKPRNIGKMPVTPQFSFMISSKS